MAFNRNSNAQQSNDNNTKNDNWKAAAFINFYLPSQDGGRTKLGALPLRPGDKKEKVLIDWLMGPNVTDEQRAKRMQKIMDDMVFEFRSAEPAEGRAFALSED